LTYVSFASFDTLYDPVRFMYEKRTASIQILILRLMVLRNMVFKRKWLRNRLIWRGL